MNRHVKRFIHENLADCKPSAYEGKHPEAARVLLSRAAKRNTIFPKPLYRNQHVLTKGNEVVGGFDVMLTTLVSMEALHASVDRILARQYWLSSKLPHAEWQTSSDVSSASAEGADSPLLVRPASSRAGLGVTHNVAGATPLAQALDKAESRRSGGEYASEKVLIETFHEAVDLRLFVVHESVVSALVRLPLFWRGDGRSTHSELALQANASRTATPLLHRFNKSLEGWFERWPGVDSISEEGEIYFLSPHVNIRQAGLTVDVTDIVHPSHKELAVEASWAIPGSRSAAVDLLVEDVSEKSYALVQDFDAQAELVPHHYPWMGRGRSVADSIMRAVSAKSLYHRLSNV
ncbi:hypothetical protein [Nesterenkonia populi]|uniref:hypothetical protein n=1 Tax=Nesterenkonia populi TaxID=1591087 RepID=UPI0011BF8171|nr:hypothetical protein [Nesterenkonia populi]